MFAEKLQTLRVSYTPFHTNSTDFSKHRFIIWAFEEHPPHSFSVEEDLESLFDTVESRPIPHELSLPIYQRAAFLR